MPRELPAQPNLEHLRKQAKALLREWRQQDPGTRRQLSDAQHETAREYGFSTWADLKNHVETLAIAADPARALRDAIHRHDPAAMRRILASSSALRSSIDEPSAGGAFGETALIEAVIRSSGPMVDVLLEFGADINQKSHWWAGGFHVLDQASPEFAPYVIERGAVAEAPAAARLGMIDALREMIAKDPSVVHFHGPDGQTALHDASTIAIARLLLEHGADIDALDIDHESTAAQYMLQHEPSRQYPNDRKDIARELVARGCRTDILMASALGDVALVRRHLDANPESIRTRVDEQWFPKKNPDAGGTIYIWTLGHHRTAHSIAKTFGHPDVYALLMERSPRDLRFAIAAEVGDEPAFRELLREQPDLVSTLTDADKRKLADAAENSNLDAVRLMLASGWPADFMGAHHASALHWAAFHGNVDMLREILRYHPTVDIVDGTYGGTPLGWAGYGSENGWRRDGSDYPGAVQALLEAGAEPPASMDNFTATDAVRDVIARFGRTTRY
ncbi:MAG TPA: ankyrin repeat domain-containing protein [Gemmatimonadaceae bacterium]|jgi:ankyrin repeat protein|nr:ankyrin repeat domain-containing protein [Gemmatimonadaceae bacterium]